MKLICNRAYVCLAGTSEYPPMERGNNIAGCSHNVPHEEGTFHTCRTGCTWLAERAGSSRGRRCKRQENTG